MIAGTIQKQAVLCEGWMPLAPYLGAEANDAKRRQVRFPGLVSAAEELGVHRNHLYLVASGKRKSKRLMDQFLAWKARQEKQAIAGGKPQ